MARGVSERTKGFADARYRALIEQLAAERKAQGLSQGALADKLHSHQQFVSRFETGERRLDIIEFVDVAVALGLDPSSLLVSIASSASR